MCSASYKGTCTGEEVLNVAAGTLPLASLFSKEQRAFYAAHAPAGVSLDTCRRWVRCSCCAPSTTEDLRPPGRRRDVAPTRTVRDSRDLDRMPPAGGYFRPQPSRPTSRAAASRSPRSGPRPRQRWSSSPSRRWRRRAGAEQQPGGDAGEPRSSAGDGPALPGARRCRDRPRRRRRAALRTIRFPPRLPAKGGASSREHGPRPATAARCASALTGGPRSPTSPDRCCWPAPGGPASASAPRRSCSMTASPAWSAVRCGPTSAATRPTATARRRRRNGNRDRPEAFLGGTGRYAAVTEAAALRARRPQAACRASRDRGGAPAAPALAQGQRP